MKLISQKDLLERIDAAIKSVTTTSVLGTGAMLQPQKLARFLRKLQDKTVVLPAARFMLMEAPKVEIDSIGFDTPIMRSDPGENVAMSESDYAEPTHKQEVLEAVELQAVISMTDRMLRRNIEKKAFENTMIDLMGQRAGLDLELLGILGDVDGSGGIYALYPYLTDNNGWLKRSKRRVIEDSNKARTGDFNTIAAQTTHALDHGSGIDSGMDGVAYGVPIVPDSWELDLDDDTLKAHDDGNGNIVQDGASGISGTIDYESGHVSLIGLTASTGYKVAYTAAAFDEDASSGLLFPENMFEQMMLAYPKTVLADPTARRQLRMYVPWTYENQYRNLLKTRGTDLGDVAQTKNQAVVYKDIPIVPVPAMSDLKRAWLTLPSKTAYGVFYEVEIEREREAKKRRTDVILNLENDYGFEDPEYSVVAEVIETGP